MANKFCDLIETEILSKSSHFYVLISMLLPRCDFQERSGMSNPNNVRKVINVQITSRLYENPRVTLINSDHILGLDHNEERKRELMHSDGYHLTEFGFNLMLENWMSTLNKHASMASSMDHTNPLLESDTEDSNNQLGANDLNVKVDAKETVPDPFGTYTAPSDVIAAKTKLEEESVKNGDFKEELDDDDVPNLETVDPGTEVPEKNAEPFGAKFQLGVGNSNDEEGFIEDNYCGTEVSATRPLPSLNLVSSGPESDLVAVSGMTVFIIFFFYGNFRR